MAINGVLFDNQKPAAKNIAIAFAPLFTDGFIIGGGLSVEGSTIKVGTGVAVVCGRIVDISSVQSVSVSGTGIVRVLLTIDLNRAASTTEFSQVVLSSETVADENEFAPLTQDNINRGGKVYQIELCRYTVSNSAVGTRKRGLPKASPKIDDSNIFMGAYYGDNLPAAGNPGRVFFKKQV